MSKIHVVWGMTGTEETYVDWPVIAYFDKPAAIRHAEMAEARAKEIYPRWEWTDGIFTHVLNGVNEYDPHMEKDGDVTYTVYSVDIADAQPLPPPTPHSIIPMRQPVNHQPQRGAIVNEVIMNEKQQALYDSVLALVKTDPNPYNETSLADWLIAGDTEGMTPAEIAAEWDEVNSHNPRNAPTPRK